MSKNHSIFNSSGFSMILENLEKFKLSERDVCYIDPMLVESDKADMKSCLSDIFGIRSDILDMIITKEAVEYIENICPNYFYLIQLLRSALYNLSRLSEEDNSLITIDFIKGEVEQIREHSCGRDLVEKVFHYIHDSSSMNIDQLFHFEPDLPDGYSLLFKNTKVRCIPVELLSPIDAVELSFSGMVLMVQGQMCSNPFYIYLS